MKHFFLFILIAFSFNAFAQIEIDERDLVGTWNVSEVIGSWGYTPKALIFQSSGYCEYQVEESTPHKLNRCAFVITNKDKLHIFSGNSFSFNPSFTTFAFVIEDFVKGQYMKLSSFDESASITLLNENYTSIQAIKADEYSNNAPMYNIQGIEISHPSGFYIQGGKKKMAPFDEMNE